MHALMFWGFCALFLGTILATIDYDITLRLPLGLDFKLLQGPFYLLYELSLDLFGLFFVVGLGLALYRRFVVRPARIDPTPQLRVDPRPALRHQRHRLRARGLPARGGQALVGARGRRSAGRWGSVFLALGLGEGALRGLHLGTWLFHFTISFAFIALIPHSYFIHLLTTPLNTFLVKLDPAGRAEADPEHRGGGVARRLEARGVLLEAAARLRRLHDVRPLPGRLPRLSRGDAAVAEAGHPEAPRV